MSLGKLWCVSFMDFFLSFSFFFLSLSFFPQFFYKEGALHFTSYAITHDIFLLVHDCSVGVTWSNTPQLKLRSVQWFTPWSIPQFSNLTFNLMKVFIYIEFKMREHFDIFREGEKYFSVHTFIPKNTSKWTSYAVNSKLLVNILYHVLQKTFDGSKHSNLHLGKNIHKICQETLSVSRSNSFPRAKLDENCELCLYIIPRISKHFRPGLSQTTPLCQQSMIHE